MSNACIPFGRGGEFVTAGKFRLYTVFLRLGGREIHTVEVSAHSAIEAAEIALRLYAPSGFHVLGSVQAGVPLTVPLTLVPAE